MSVPLHVHFRSEDERSAMPCKHCIDLCRVRRLRWPDDLAHVIAMIRDSQADSTLREVMEFDPRQHVSLPFERLVTDGPGPHPFRYHFACHHCGEVFELHGKTHPEVTGEWSPVRRESRREDA